MNVILLHGMSFHFQDGSFGPSLIKSLKDNHLDFESPEMPVGTNVSYNAWNLYFDKIKNKITDKTIIIAFSLSALYLPKFLAEAKLKPYAIITIAGAKINPLASKIPSHFRNFIPMNKDFDYVKKSIPNKFAFYSDNDHIFSLYHLEDYAQSIGAEQLFLKNHGHFGNRSGITEIPELNQLVLNLSKNLINLENISKPEKTF